MNTMTETASPYSSPRIFERIPSQDDLQWLLLLLGGLKSAFAEEVYNAQTAQLTLFHHDSPLTPELLQQSLQGHRSLWFYPIDENMQACILLLRYYIKPSQATLDAYMQTTLLQSAIHHVNILLHHNIVSYLVQNDKISLYLYIFLAASAHFLMLREIAIRLVNTLPLPKSGIAITPFLYTEPRGLHWQESAVPIPLTQNSIDGTYRFFLCTQRQVVHEDQIAHLRRIKRQELAVIREFIGKGPWARADFSPKRMKTGDDISRLQDACGVIRHLTTKAQHGRRLTEEERRVLYYTIGFLSHEAMHHILSLCPDYKPKTVDRQLANLYVRPISCPRIRELLPGLTSAMDCHCVFDPRHLQLGRYPSPLLHVQPELVPSMDKRYSAAYATSKEIGQRYLTVLQELQAVAEELNVLKRELIVSLKACSRPFVRVGDIEFSLNEDGDLKIKNL